jgi:tRNA 2-thiouridine synthesizing protein A
VERKKKMAEIRLLDCIGALCPTPIIELSKAVRELSSGERLILKADDPATKSDLLAWSRMTGNQVTVISESQFEIVKN